MVHYPRPRYITKGHMRRAREYAFSVADRRGDHVAQVATCLRCAQNISKQRRQCRRPEHRRCKHCTDGNRGGCTLVPAAMNGCVNRLYVLRGAYDAAVTAAAIPRTDAAVIRTGVTLARAQRAFNLTLSDRRRTAAHTGTPLGVPTQVPTTTPQYLSLILVEQRRIASALEQLVGHAARMGQNNNDDSHESDSQGSSSSSSESGDEPPTQGARRAPEGRGGGEREEHASDDEGDDEEGAE